MHISNQVMDELIGRLYGLMAGEWLCDTLFGCIYHLLHNYIFLLLLLLCYILL